MMYDRRAGEDHHRDRGRDHHLGGKGAWPTGRRNLRMWRMIRPERSRLGRRSEIASTNGREIGGGAAGHSFDAPRAPDLIARDVFRSEQRLRPAYFQ